MQELQQDIEAAQTGRPRYNDDNVVEAEVVREVKDPEQTPKTLR
jgi:hypothetical protein